MKRSVPEASKRRVQVLVGVDAHRALQTGDLLCPGCRRPMTTSDLPRCTSCRAGLRLGGYAPIVPYTFAILVFMALAGAAAGAYLMVHVSGVQGLGYFDLSVGPKGGLLVGVQYLLVMNALIWGLRLPQIMLAITRRRVLAAIGLMVLSALLLRISIRLTSGMWWMY